MFSLLEFLSLIELLNDFHDWKLTEIAVNDVRVFFSLLHCQIVAPRGNEIYPAGFETTWPKLKTVKLQLTNACNASFVFISFFFCYKKMYVLFSINNQRIVLFLNSLLHNLSKNWKKKNSRSPVIKLDGNVT